MKINQIIREKRKALCLTQEQIADCLGVSTSAVNKWEKGSTYPDITLLPALARLLKTDLNTLLSFREDLSEVEIENFVTAVDETAQSAGYEAAFQMAVGQIREYPTCEKLIYSVIFYLEGALFLYCVPEPEHYRETFEPFYQRLAASETAEIRDMALTMLISYARNRGDFAKAEELIQALPSSAIDKEEQLAILYQQQKRKDAQKIWEQRVLSGVTKIQTALINLLEAACVENRDQDAQFIADLYESVSRDFCFPEWMRYNGHLLVALEQQDREQSLDLLKSMLPAMKKEWEPRSCRLYRFVDRKDTSRLSARIADAFCDEINRDQECAFIHDSPEWKELLSQIKS